MNKKKFSIILSLFGIAIIAMGILGYSLYNASKELEDAIKAKKEQKKFEAKSDEAELKRIADERESSLAKELNASLAREKATEEENESTTSPAANQNNVSTESLLASLRGTWEGGGTIDGAYVVLTVMAFDGSSGWAYTNYKGRTLWDFDTITISSLGNNEYGIYNGRSLFAKYNTNGNLIDINGVIMKRVSTDIPAEPFSLKTYFSNTFCDMGEYGIEEQYAHKHLIEEREGIRSGNTTFRIISREKNVLLYEYKCGKAQQVKSDNLRKAVGIQYLGKETHSGEQSKITVELKFSTGKYQIYTSSTNSKLVMYNCKLMVF